MNTTNSDLKYFSTDCLNSALSWQPLFSTAVFISSTDLTLEAMSYITNMYVILSWKSEKWMQT